MVATLAADGVLALRGNHVIALPELVTLLDKTVNGTTVRALLQGSILADADGHKLRAAPVSSLPGSLFVLARKLAGALPVSLRASRLSPPPDRPAGAAWAARTFPRL